MLNWMEEEGDRVPLAAETMPPVPLLLLLLARVLRPTGGSG